MDKSYLTQLVNGTNSKPLVCLEVNPPKGTDYEPIFKRLDEFHEGIHFFNITDSALARLKCAPIPFGYLLKERYGIEPLINCSCRDRNSIALQSDLLGGWILGIRSFIALTGDAVALGDHKEAKAVFEMNSVKLLETMSSLNNGRDISGAELIGAPKFVPGVVVNPNARNMEAEIKRLQKKKEAGALYALSQPVFEEESSVEFFKLAGELKIPILMGLLPFKNKDTAANFCAIPGIKICEDMIKKIESLDSASVEQFSLDLCLKLVKLNSPHVAGFHIISGRTPKLALKLTSEVIKGL